MKNILFDFPKVDYHLKILIVNLADAQSAAWELWSILLCWYFCCCWTIHRSLLPKAHKPMLMSWLAMLRDGIWPQEWSFPLERLLLPITLKLSALVLRFLWSNDSNLKISGSKLNSQMVSTLKKHWMSSELNKISTWQHFQSSDPDNLIQILPVSKGFSLVTGYF